MIPRQAMTFDVPPSASLLRHDLVAPVNHVLGFCDLLIEDAESKGRVYRSLSLRSIRSFGEQALAAIDGALDRDGGRALPIDLPGLGLALIAPAAAIAEACEALEDASSRVPDRLEFLDDLDKVRAAAARLLAAGEALAGSRD